jgi:PII-like signaling protein
MRIFIGEEDRFEKRPLFEALVEALRSNGIAGATVLKGIEGYGARRELHAARSVDFSSNLPVVIEVAETAEKIRSLVPLLRSMIAEGLITLETIRFAHR